MINGIRNINASVKYQNLNSINEMVNYANIGATGYSLPLSTESNAVFQCNITLPDVVQIVSGETSLIALTKQGNVFGRGRNTYGELAIGDRLERQTWSQIDGFSCPVVQVAYNHRHALFLTVGGNVFSCGSNEHGQLV